MTITETSKGFEVTFQYDLNKVNAMKKIPGAWYQGATKTWNVPRHRANDIEVLKKIFRVSSYKSAEVIAEKQFETVPELPPLTVDLKEAGIVRDLYPYQGPGVQYCLEKLKCIIGDKMGLGKTTQAIAAVTVKKAFPCLVVCPNIVKFSWQNEWRDVAGKRAMILDDKSRNTWHRYFEVGYIDVFIVNYESLKKFFVESILKKKEESLRVKHIIFREQAAMLKSLIVDESHRCKDGTTQQSKFIMGLSRGMEMVLELTGTILVNGPRDVIAQLTIINRLHEVVAHIPQMVDDKGRRLDASGYQRFVDRYCWKPDPKKRDEVDLFNKRLKELHYRLRNICFYSREKSEVLKDLPPKTRNVILCDISNRDQYNRAQEEFKEYLQEVKACDDPRLRNKMAGFALVKMMELKTLSARGKIRAVKEHVDEVLENGEKLILFCHLKEIVRQLKDLYPDALTITGDDEPYERQRSIDRFQNDPKDKLIICSLTAAGVGITLTASSNVSFVEFPWTFALCEQAEDRAHRIGQKDSVNCNYFLGEDTIDRYCYYEIIQKKKFMAMTVAGGTDDVEESIIDQLLNLFNQE